jgi:Protein of unknown function (DUF3108)
MSLAIEFSRSAVMIVPRVSGTLEYTRRTSAGQESQNDFRARMKTRLLTISSVVAALAPLLASFSFAAIKEQPMPFRAGETLNYRVSWSAFSTAASVRLSVVERRVLFGWQTWHFRAVAQTLSPVSTLFPIEDQFDSYTDTESLECRQFESHLNELGKISDQVVHLVATGQKSRAPGASVIVMPGTRDPLGALYALRAVDWQRTPELNVAVFDGKDIFDMRAQRDSPGEAVSVPAGNFTASRISIKVFQHEKEMTAIHVAIWLATDAAHTPVVLQATLPFGTLRAELIPTPN